MSQNEKLHAVLTEYIRPATFPVAVKILIGDNVPANARRPQEVFGHSIALCQGMSIARRYGWTMAFLQEDHACPISLVIFGMIEEPEFIKDGSIVYPLYAESLEKGAKTQAATPKMLVGQVKGVVLAPLNKADFDPDVIVIYGNPGQMVRLVQGALYKEGGDIESHFMGRGACGSEIVVPYLKKAFNVIIPGGGEKIFGATADDEMAFAAPGEKLEGLMEGIVVTHKSGVARIPTPFFGLRAKPEFPKIYQPLGDHCGLR